MNLSLHHLSHLIIWKSTKSALFTELHRTIIIFPRPSLGITTKIAYEHMNRKYTEQYHLFYCFIFFPLFFLPNVTRSNMHYILLTVSLHNLPLCQESQKLLTRIVRTHKPNIRGSMHAGQSPQSFSQHLHSLFKHTDVQTKTLQP